jgi:hypothetical protein
MQGVEWPSSTAPSLPPPPQKSFEALPGVLALQISFSELFGSHMYFTFLCKF